MASALDGHCVCAMRNASPHDSYSIDGETVSLRSITELSEWRENTLKLPPMQTVITADVIPHHVIMFVDSTDAMSCMGL